MEPEANNSLMITIATETLTEEMKIKMTKAIEKNMSCF